MIASPRDTAHLRRRALLVRQHARQGLEAGGAADGRRHGRHARRHRLRLRRQAAARARAPLRLLRGAPRATISYARSSAAAIHARLPRTPLNARPHARPYARTHAHTHAHTPDHRLHTVSRPHTAPRATAHRDQRFHLAASRRRRPPGRRPAVRLCQPAARRLREAHARAQRRLPCGNRQVRVLPGRRTQPAGTRSPRVGGHLMPTLRAHPYRACLRVRAEPPTPHTHAHARTRKQARTRRQLHPRVHPSSDEQRRPPTCSTST